MASTNKGDGVDGCVPGSKKMILVLLLPKVRNPTPAAKHIIYAFWKPNAGRKTHYLCLENPTPAASGQRHKYSQWPIFT